MNDPDFCVYCMKTDENCYGTCYCGGMPRTEPGELVSDHCIGDAECLKDYLKGVRVSDLKYLSENDLLSSVPSKHHLIAKILIRKLKCQF